MEKKQRLTTDTESCCTCASLLSDAPRYNPSSEKPLPSDRTLECCGRVICGNCIHNNPRFSSYCPYCQISQSTSALPPGLKEPPSYGFATRSKPAPTLTSTSTSTSATAPRPPSQIQDKEDDDEAPPPYSLPNGAQTTGAEKPEPAQDTLHFLRRDDSVASLSLRYGVPAAVLRRANRLGGADADHLLAGRRTVVIPGTHYGGGVSLSPEPVGGEDEERRRTRIRRWMVACKVHDYDVALLYLEQAAYDVDAAAERYRADEDWERRNPLAAAQGKGKARVKPSTRSSGGGSGSGGRWGFR